MSKKQKDAVNNRKAQEEAVAGSRHLTREENTARESGLHTHMRRDVSDDVSVLETEMLDRKNIYVKLATLLNEFKKGVKNADTRTVLSEQYHLMMEELELMDASMDGIIDKLDKKHERRKEFIREQNQRKETIGDVTSRFNALMNASWTPAAGS